MKWSRRLCQGKLGWRNNTSDKNNKCFGIKHTGKDSTSSFPICFPPPYVSDMMIHVELREREKQYIFFLKEYACYPSRSTGTLL